MLVSGERASEHDSFSGACNAKVVTPPPSDGSLQPGGGSVTAGACVSRHVAALMKAPHTPVFFTHHSGREYRDRCGIDIYL